MVVIVTLDSAPFGLNQIHLPILCCVSVQKFESDISTYQCGPGLKDCSCLTYAFVNVH